MPVYEGGLQAKEQRFAIVVSRYNALITEQLLTGALSVLHRHGVSDDAIDIYRVPGSWEIPLVAARCARSKRYDAVICLGAVLQGETSHAHHISASVCHALTQLMLETEVPMALGILTEATFEQALERAGGKAGNKGAEAALSALEMTNLLHRSGGKK
ncbi:6,7-dimethyl-8-ribityllumazine synthase [bacterium HR15]|nr:6,7-dimethyl-8-ribityllumazine synthase [bacterium HR15]